MPFLMRPGALNDPLSGHRHSAQAVHRGTRISVSTPIRGRDGSGTPISLLAPIGKRVGTASQSFPERMLRRPGQSRPWGYRGGFAFWNTGSPFARLGSRLVAVLRPLPCAHRRYWVSDPRRFARCHRSGDGVSPVGNFGLAPGHTCRAGRDDCDRPDMRLELGNAFASPRSDVYELRGESGARRENTKAIRTHTKSRSHEEEEKGPGIPMVWTSKFSQNRHSRYPPRK